MPKKPAKKLKIVRSIKDLREQVSAWRRDGLRVGLVPTMGALHGAHLSLVAESAKHADKVVVSIFVNPAQFAPGEDYDQYPRDEQSDIDKLSEMPTDLIYIPTVEEVYPQPTQTLINMTDIAQGLCAGTRPHFFDGVALVVLKLFNQVQPDSAVFGEKDYQQLLVIRRFVSDLNLPIEIVGAAIGREKDGLAMSSRNQYLAPTQRQIAGTFNTVLKSAVSAIEGGEPIDATISLTKKALESSGFDRVEYLEMRDAYDLSPVARLNRPARLLAAVHLGKIRLIDNFPVTPQA